MTMLLRTTLPLQHTDQKVHAARPNVVVLQLHWCRGEALP
jgi:hypothetical protein